MPKNWNLRTGSKTSTSADRKQENECKARDRTFHISQSPDGKQENKCKAFEYSKFPDHKQENEHKASTS